MNEMVRQLAAVCRQHPLEEKLLFVPSYSIGHQIREHLAKSGTPWIHLMVTTAVGYALELTALDLSARGIRLITPEERFVMIETLYRGGDISVGGGQYFGGAEEIPGILKCLGDAGHEMRMAGLDHAKVVLEEGLDLELLAENLLIEEERLVSERDSVVAAVRSAMFSELWGRMKRAETALVEVPFSIQTEGKEVPKIVSGVMDLVFKEADGWVIADFKTDKVDGNLGALVAHYKPQVEMYRNFRREISGEDVKEAGLYFVDMGQWVVI